MQNCGAEPSRQLSGNGLGLVRGWDTPGAWRWRLVTGFLGKGLWKACLRGVLARPERGQVAPDAIKGPSGALRAVEPEQGVPLFGHGQSGHSPLVPRL